MRIIAAAALLEAAGAGSAAADPACASSDASPQPVARVIDGETLVLAGGQTLRLSGILAPRPYDAGTPTASWPAADASRKVLTELVNGNSVRLTYAARRRFDRYGRVIAQAFVDTAGAKPLWLQAEMVRAGAARALAGPGEAHCLTALLEFEQAARAASRGLWREAAYATRAAQDVTSLLRLHGTYQLVRGRVQTVTVRRSRIYINFAEDWRRDFTVSVSGRQIRQLVASGIDAAALRGGVMEVRGWIELRGGPYIELSDARELRVVELGKAAGPANDKPAGR